MRNDESIDLIDRQLQAVADRTRLRILLLLSGGERCVCDIVDGLELPQPKVSRHLATLRAAGLVRSRVHANWRHYSLAEPESDFHRKLIDCVLCCVSCIPELAADARRLADMPVCCAPEEPLVQLRSAEAKAAPPSSCCDALEPKASKPKTSNSKG